MSDEQARRVGLNEALFRQVNEQIRGLTSTFGTEDGTMTVVCECGDAGCTHQLEVGIADESHEGWEVVRKREGVPAEVAQETDPRS
jgi:hypothetical protein